MARVCCCHVNNADVPSPRPASPTRSQELFYQLVLRGFGDFNTIDLEPPVDIKAAVLIALELCVMSLARGCAWLADAQQRSAQRLFLAPSRPEAKWSAEDGPKEDIAVVGFFFLLRNAWPAVWLAGLARP